MAPFIWCTGLVFLHFPLLSLHSLSKFRIFLFHVKYRYFMRFCYFSKFLIESKCNDNSINWNNRNKWPLDNYNFNLRIHLDRNSYTKICTGCVKILVRRNGSGPEVFRWAWRIYDSGSRWIINPTRWLDSLIGIKQTLIQRSRWTNCKLKLILKCILSNYWIQFCFIYVSLRMKKIQHLLIFKTWFVREVDSPFGVFKLYQWP